MWPRSFYLALALCLSYDFAVSPCHAESIERPQPLLSVVGSVQTKPSSSDQALAVTLPKVFLLGVPNDAVQITLPELDLDSEPWPELLTLAIYADGAGSARLLHKQVLNTTSETGQVNQPKLTHKVERLTLDELGSIELHFRVEGAPECTAATFVVFAWLSLLPAFVTLAVAVALKQVVLALLLGIWTGTFNERKHAFDYMLMSLIEA